MEAVWVALIVAAGALATTFLNGVQLRRSKVQDYARQDEVASAAAMRDSQQEERQTAVAEQAAEAARLLIADNAHRAQVLADAGEVVNGKLNQIHELVNAAMTAAMTSEHVALKAQQVAIRRVLALESGPASKQDEEALAELGRRIAELGAKLSDRERQTAVADALVVPPK